MKLYTMEPLAHLRILIKRQGEPSEYFTIIDCSREYCLSKFKELLSPHGSAIVEGSRLNIQVRDSIGGKNGESESFSIYGISVEKAKKVIFDFLDSENFIDKNFKRGDRVFDIRHKWGYVKDIDNSEELSILVMFDNGRMEEYSSDGRPYMDSNRTLYHYDYTPKK